MTNRRPWLIVLSTLLLSILLFVLGFWWLISSVKIGNTPLAINARGFFYFNLGPKLGLNLNKLPFEINPMQKVNTDEGLVYIYIILGRYENIDFNNQTLYLSTKNGNLYGFKYSPNQDEPISYKDLKAGGSQISKLGVSPFIQGEVLSIQWEDKRTLSKILSDAKTDPLYLVNPNMNFSGFQLINKLSQ